MKKLLLLFTAFAVTTTVFSQARFGIKGGISLPNQKIKASLGGQSGSNSGDGIVSFHVGGVAEIPLGSHFAFRPELLLSGKGANFECDISGDPGTMELRPFYIEIPLNFVYAYDFPGGARFYGGAGPSVGIGAFGSIKFQQFDEDIFQDSGFNRLDFGINLLAGIELNSGLTLGVNFTPGIANIYSQDLEGIDINWTNRVFSFSIGYMFNRRRD